MNTNRIIVVLFAALLLLGGCKKSNEFTIRGKITHAEGKTIYLEELLVSSSQPVAEMKISKKGEFEFKGNASIPTFYLLRLSETNFITLLVDSTEKIVINADVVNFWDDYSVEGSLGSLLVKDLNDKLYGTRAKLDSLNNLEKLYRGNPNYKAFKKQWDEDYKNVIQEQIDFSTNFVMENPFSMASVLALYQKFNINDPGYIISDLQTMRTAASALNSIYPNSKQVQALYKNTLEYIKAQRAASMHQFIQEQGDNSPDIVLPNPDGKEIALSSLRGKVVLLQFWAAEDRGSRIVNPTLVEAYKKYNNKGFEIYQVSVDKNRMEWVDAIDKDKLSWINVGDMNGSNQAALIYNIKSIPYNYLLNEEGIIVAKDLKGPALDKTIGQVLKK